MIGQHPELAGLPELKLFAYETIEHLEASLPPYWAARGFVHRSPGLVRAIAELAFGSQSLSSLASAREWLRRRSHWTGAEVRDFLLERVAPRHGVEKSPENVESKEALGRLWAAYPRARFLHLTRHPVTTQQSLEQHLKRTVPGFSIPDQPISGIAYWLETHLRILCFTAPLPQSSSLRVRAEDVLNDPVHQLRKVAEWLGLRDDESAIEAMRHPEASPFACPAPAGSGLAGGQDREFLRKPVPHRVPIPAALEQPSGWVGNAMLWDKTAAIAARLGYA